eukprot:CCRYP_005907-RA/>CCRYP_005907-RA protein AED:0.36 eAED:0.36 QI:0/-1/0/1/-1/0/1/0/145
MYTKIKTDVALTLISQLIHQELSKPLQPSYTEALVSALHIVFTNSIVKFGDTYLCQTSGTGMGIAPAPSWATTFYALHEQHFVPKWSTHLIFTRDSSTILLAFGFHTLTWLPTHHSGLRSVMTFNNGMASSGPSLSVQLDATSWI